MRREKLYDWSILYFTNNNNNNEKIIQNAHKHHILHTHHIIYYRLQIIIINDYIKWYAIIKECSNNNKHWNDKIGFVSFRFDSILLWVCVCVLCGLSEYKISMNEWKRDVSIKQ